MPKFDFKTLNQTEEKIPLREQPIFREIQDFFRDNSKKWYSLKYIKNHFKIIQEEATLIIKTLFDQSDLRRKEELNDTKVLSLYKWYSEEPHDMPLSPEARKTLQKRKDAKKEVQHITKDTAILDLIQEVKALKEKVNELEVEKVTLPDEVYNDLWLLCRSELSKWTKKSDSMLNSTNHIINYFHIDLSKNPLKTLKEGSE